MSVAVRDAMANFVRLNGHLKFAGETAVSGAKPWGNCDTGRWRNIYLQKGRARDFSRESWLGRPELVGGAAAALAAETPPRLSGSKVPVLRRQGRGTRGRRPTCAPIVVGWPISTTE